MNKEQFIQKLMAQTGRSENDCIVINSILEDHNIIGHKNQAKIKADFMAKLKVTEEEADELYNICMGTIVQGIFKR